MSGIITLIDSSNVQQGSFATIQDAIDAAQAGWVISLTDGTYSLTSTLNVNKDVTIIGQSETGVIIDASGVSGYGIYVDADGATLSTFTLNGPTANAGSSFGIKIQPNSSDPADRISNVTLEHVTVKGSGRTEIDINGGNNIMLTDLTADGMGTSGNGIALTDSSNVTLTDITTTGNNWGSVALYNANRFYDNATGDITFNGAYSASEAIKIYAQDTSNGVTGDGNNEVGTPPVSTNLGQVNFPGGGQPWVVTNDAFRAGATTFKYFFATEGEASAFALSIQQAPYTANARSVVEAPDGVIHVYAGMSIQAAIDAASTGDTIVIGSGTYTEQVIVDGKSDLTIQEAVGGTVVIKAPADVVETARSSSDREMHAVITVKNGENVQLVGLGVDGDGRANTVDENTGAGQAQYVGVFYRNASGTLTNVDITGARDPYENGTTVGGHPVISGIQRGVGLQVDNDSLKAFTMTGGSISDFQKNATVFNRADLNMSGVTVTGGGAQTIIAQNGIQVLNSTGSISGNTISGIGYAGQANAYSGAVLAYGNTNLTISDNTIIGANGETPAAKVVGIFLLDFGVPNSNIIVTGNTISHADEGIDVSGSVGATGFTISNNTVTLIDTSDPYAAGVQFYPTASPAPHTVNGTTAFDYLQGGQGDDTLNGLAGNDIIDGGAGNDIIDGGLDIDTLISSATLSTGNLSIVGGKWVVNHGAGNVDTVENVEKINDAGANDLLLVGAGGYTDQTTALNTAAVGDRIASFTGGATTIITKTATGGTGGSSNDVVDYGSATGSIIFDAGDGDNNVTTGSGDDKVTTGSGNDTVKTGNGNDVVSTGAGNDTVIGGSGGGDDLYDAGTHTTGDTIAYPSTNLGVNVDLRPMDRSGNSTVSTLLTSNSYAANTPVGLATGAEIGTDVLVNFEHAIGGTGDDLFIGNAGNNTFDGGTGSDTADYSHISTGTGISTAISGTYTVSTTAGGTDTLISIENIVGTQLLDIVTGDSANNTFDGNGGDDTFNGLGGIDMAVMDSTAAADSIALQAGATLIVSGSVSDGTDTLTNVEKIVFANGTVDVVSGNAVMLAQNDTGTAIEAGSASVLNGGNGNVGSDAAGNVLSNDFNIDQGGADQEAVTAIAFGSTTGTVGSALAGAFGSLTIGTNGAYTYAVDNDNPSVRALLPSSAPLTEVFTYTVDDGSGNPRTATLTISIDGANDTPTASTVTTLANAVEDSAYSLDLSTLFADVDHAVGTTGIGGYTYSVSGGPAGLAIAADGKTLSGTVLDAQANTTYSLIITATDPLGASLQRMLDLFVENTNDTPTVVTPQAAAVTEDVDTDSVTPGVQTSASGNLLAGSDDGDANVGDDLDIVSINSILPSSGTITITDADGTLTVDAETGDYTYTLNNSSTAVQALANGAPLVKTFNFTASDGGTAPNSANGTLNVTITGANDAPTVAAALTSNISEGASAYTLDLLAGATDGDTGETATLSIANVTYSIDAGPASATLPSGLSLSGATLSVDPSATAFDYLGVGDQRQIVVNYNVVDASGGSVPQTATITVAGTNDLPTIGFAQGFESGRAGIFDGSPYGAVNVVPTGTGGIPAAEGISFALLSEVGGSGPFTRFDGYRATFSDDATASIKIYLDPNWVPGSGFDYAVAANGTDGAHQRDFIFHVAKDTSTGQLLIGASNNTNFSVREDIETLATHASVINAGWYTFQHTFRDAGGQLAVDLQVNDSSGAVVFTHTLSSAADTIPGETGGNRYGWFTDITVPGGLAVDNWNLGIYRGSVTERPDGAGDEGTALLSLSELIPFADLDLTDTHTVSVVPDALGYVGTFAAAIAETAINDGKGMIRWTFDLADSAVDSLAAGQTLTQSYTVTVTDPEGGTASQTITVSITGTNDAPTLAAVAGITLNDTSGDDLFGATTGMLVGMDADISDTLTYGIMGGSASTLAPYTHEKVGTYGTLYVNSGTGAYRFEPNDGAIEALKSGATETFTFTVSDGIAPAISQNLVITLNGANDTPVITTSGPLVLVVNEDGSTSGSIAFTDRDTGEIFTYQVSTAATNGSASHVAGLSAGTSDFTYTPDSNFSGSDNFTLQVTDGSGATAQIAANVTVNPESDTPNLSVTATVSGNEDTAIPLTINPALTDPSETLSVTIAGIPSGATFSGTNLGVTTVTTGSLTLAPNQLAGLTITTPANSYADFSLSVTATSQDGSAPAATSAAQTINVTVNSVADPDFYDDDATLSATVLTPAGNLLIGTGNPGSGFHIATDAADAPGVEIGLKAFVRFTGNYTLDPSDTSGRTYVVNSGTVAQGPAALNQPGAQDDGWARWSYAVSLGADTDSNGGSLSDLNYIFTIERLEGAGGPASITGTLAAYLAAAETAGAILPGAAATILAGKVYQDIINLEYVPGILEAFDPTAPGKYRISVSATDSEGVTALANYIDIKIVNDAPDAVADSFTTAEDTPITLTAAQLLGNDTDPNAQVLSVTVVGGETNGTIVNNGNGTYTFTPAANFNGTASFTYTVSDGQNPALTDTAAVTINVTPVNDAPVAADPTFVSAPISEDGPAFNGILGSLQLPFSVFAADIDTTLTPGMFSFVGASIDGGTPVSASSAGISYNSTTGAFTFDPTSIDGYQSIPQGSFKDVVVTFNVNDGEFTDQGTVTFRVNGANDAPIVISGPQVGQAWEDGDLDNVVEAGINPLVVNGFEPKLDLDAIIGPALQSDPTAVAALLNTLLVSHLPAGSTMADAIAQVWDFLDDTYVAGNNYYNIAANEPFAYLGIEYAKYLKAGGKPLTDVTVKYTPDGGDVDSNPDRLQSMHDNLLGNLNGSTLNDRFASVPSVLSAITAAMAGPVNISDLLLRPVFSGNEGAVNLALPFDLTNGYLPVASGQLQANDVDTGAALTWSVTGSDVYGTLTINPTTGEWSYVLDNSDPDTRALDEGQTATETYTATVSDGLGGTATQTITITVKGANDAPVANASVSFPVPIAEGATFAGTMVPGAPTSATQILIASLVADVDDIIQTNGLNFTGATINGNPVANLAAAGISYTSATGAFSINTAGIAQYEALGVGDIATVVISYTGTDDNGATSNTGTVTFTVTGTNDSPVVGVADLSGATTEGTPTAGTLTDTGTISFTDIDLSDAHSANAAYVSSSHTVQLGTLTASVTTQATGGGTGVVTWSYSVDDAVIQFLSEGQVVTETHRVTLTDGETGGTVTQDVVVTITGTNDAPVITTTSGVNVAPGALSETAETSNAAASAGTLSANGTLAFDDVDGLDTFTASVDSVAVLGGNAQNPSSGTLLALMTAPNGGPVTEAGGINWSFSGAESLFDYLNAGETLTLTYTLRVIDNQGGSDNQTVTITVNGQNDAPTLSVGGSDVVALSVDEAPSATPQDIAALSGTLTVNDVDHGDAITGRVIGSPTITWSAGALVGANATGVAALTAAGALTFGIATPSGASASLGWTYDPAGANLDFLSEEDTLTVSYTVEAYDGALASPIGERKTITITINGKNEIALGSSDDDVIGLGTNSNGVGNGVGTNFADDIYGFAGDDDLTAGNGNDDIYGGDGSDTINAGSGNDLIFGDTANAAENASAPDAGNDGDDTILAGSGNDIAYGGGGSDFIDGGANDDKLYGEDGDDTLQGGSGLDLLDGGAGDDTLLGGAANDTLIGGAGNDYIDGGSDQDILLLTGNWADYVITKSGSIYTIEARIGQPGEIDGTDTVINVEKVRFLGLDSNPGNDVEKFLGTVVSAAPVLNNKTVLHNENTSGLSIVNAATDANLSAGVGETLSYALIGGTAGYADKFEINAVTGSITLKAGETLDFEAVPVWTLQVEVTDAQGLSDTATVTINVGNLSETGIGSISDSNAAANVVNENTGAGTLAGITAHAVDPDALDVVTYSLLTAAGTDGSAGGLFAINATTGVVTVLGAIDREALGASQSITVRATSSDGSSSHQTFAITINDVNEFMVTPVAQDGGSLFVTEGNYSATASAVLLDVSANDADATNNAVSYALIGGTGEFAINAAGEVTAVGLIDREAAATRTLTVQATSQDGSIAQHAFTITIGDIDESDVSSIADTNAVADFVLENAAVGTAVGITAFASDADATTNGVTYSLTTNPGNAFAIDPVTGQITIAGVIDREAGATRTIVVEAVSQDGSTSQRTFSIAIGDIDEFDVGAVTDIEIGTNTVEENSSVGTLVGVTAHAQDGDATNSGITYSLVNSTGEFAINAVTGVVTVAGAIDRELGDSRTITVRATSQDGSVNEASFAIAVSNVDDNSVGPVSDTNTGANLISETAAAGALVGITAHAVDADAEGNGVSYSIDSGFDGDGRFQIDSASGVVTYTGNGALNATIDPIHTIRVRAIGDDGSESVADFVINVTNVNQSPQAIGGTVTKAEDSSAFPLTLASFGVSDSDPGDQVESITITQLTGLGTLTLSGFPVALPQLVPVSAIQSNLLVYTPAANDDGQFAITFTASDGELSSITAVVTIDLTPVNDQAAISGTFAGNVSENGILTTSGDLNVSDVDVGEAVFATPASLSGTFGMFTFNPATGGWSYALNDAASNVQALKATDTRHDTLTVSSIDGTATKVIDVTITGANDAPTVAVELADQNATEDAAFSFAVPAGTFADVDAGDSLTLSATGLPSWLSFDGTTFTGTPANGDVGAATVTLTATDGSGATATQQIVFTVANVNDAPVANDDFSATGNNTQVSVDILANDSDVDNTIANLNILIGAVTGGTAIFDEVTRQLIFTPTAGFSGAATVGYTLSDGAASDTALVTIDVAPANNPPVANNDSGLSVSFGVPLNISATQLLSNDDDGDIGETQMLSIASVGNAVGGNVLLNANGSVTFTPTLGYTGPASFSYAVSDGNSVSLPAIVSLTVLPNTIIGSSGNDTISKIATVPGQPFATIYSDLVYGNDGADIIKTDLGDDTVYGGGGIDNIDGGGGNDTIYGGADGDVINGSAGIDTIYGEDGDDQIDGGLDNDFIYGGDGNDKLLGRDGNDQITGGRGLDDMTGGTGADHYIFNETPDALDRVRGFSTAENDKLVLETDVFAFTSLVANVNFIVGTVPGATSAVPTLLYNTANGILRYDADGTGAAAAVDVAVLVERPTLNVSDILLV